MHGYDLSACLKKVLKVRAARDWKKFHRPKELATAITIEASELLAPMSLMRLFYREGSHGQRG